MIKGLNVFKNEKRKETEIISMMQSEVDADTDETIGNNNDSMKFRLSSLSEDLITLQQSQSEIALSINSMAEGSQEQANSTQSIMTSFEHLSDILNKADDKTWDLVEDMERVSVNISSGVRSLNILNDKITEMTNVTDDVKVKITQLINDVKNIYEFMNNINSVTETIKLLSLNAQIEAARAGDAGKGFSVIAEEVNKLAKNTIEVTKNIEDSIKNINTGIENVQISINKSSTSVDEANNYLVDTKSSFDIIRDSAEKAVEKVNSVQSEVEECVNCKNEILPNVENIASVTEEFSATTQEANAVIEEQTSRLKSLSDSFENIKDIDE